MDGLDGVSVALFGAVMIGWLFRVVVVYIRNSSHLVKVCIASCVESCGDSGVYSRFLVERGLDFQVWCGVDGDVGVWMELGWCF